MTLRSPGITAILAAAIAIVVAAAAGSGPPTAAQTDPIVSVDAISDADNTATTVGSIETCAVMFNNGVKDGDETGVDTIEVDVVIQGVTNISGFQADLFYDPTVLEVTAVDYDFLLATTGAAVLDLGNSTPDTDGDFLMAAAMFHLVIVIGADGDGVLARVTLHAVGSGSSPLDLANVKLSDANGNPIPPTNANNFYTGPINDGSVAVDTSCAAQDTDGDGWPDDIEIPTGSDDLDPASTPELCNNGIDDDMNDGIDEGCASDGDNDGSNGAREMFNGTDPESACPSNSAHDAWHVDINRDKKVDVVDALGLFGWRNAIAAEADILDPLYDRRLDLIMDDPSDPSVPGDGPGGPDKRADIDSTDWLGIRGYKDLYNTTCGNGSVAIDIDGDTTPELTPAEDFYPGTPTGGPGSWFDRTYSLNPDWRVQMTASLADVSTISYRVTCPDADEHDFDIKWTEGLPPDELDTGGSHTVDCNDGSKVTVEIYATHQDVYSGP